MISLIFVLGIAALFAVLLSSETAHGGGGLNVRPAGLLTWFVSGNWPAKVGACLVIIGVGALMRYAFANLDVPPEVKLGGGMLASAVCGVGAMLLRERPERRAVYLALAGTAFGIAYLTAYSAYAFFRYVTDVNALALLAMVALATGVFAVTTRTLSVAVLAMIGAFLAPKFAMAAPTPLPVYGYYLAASLLTLVMVVLRGWRPLIHLSFLFTLAGGLFFGWSARFYEPVHFVTMQPLLLALVAVHVAMPLLENQRSGSRAFDSFYALVLPLIAAALMLKIAPDPHTDGAVGLALLAAIWALAAGGLFVARREEAFFHLLLAVLLGFGALFCYSQDLPWSLIGLGGAVIAMGAAPRLGGSRGMQQLACVVAFLCAATHVLGSVFLPVPAAPFANEVFAHRMVAAGLMVAAGWIGQRDDLSMARVLGFLGALWGGLAVFGELLRLHIDYLPQLIYGILLAWTALSALWTGFGNRRLAFSGLAIFALAAIGWWAMREAAEDISLAYLIATPLALLAVAWAGREGPATEGDESASDFLPSLAIGLLPLALAPWALAVGEWREVDTYLFEATLVVLGVAVAGATARLCLAHSPRWNNRIQPLHVYLTLAALLWVALFHIERGIWPVAFETVALAYLVAYVTRHRRADTSAGFGVQAAVTLAVALVIQAMLLRAFGPTLDVMTASDIHRMHLPAVVSLMWAVFGGCLAWWGTQSRSRAAWSAGAVLLVLAAGKLVLFDFGGLGQLGNILAFIGAGLVFLGVAWLAPMPPRVEPPPPQPEAEWADTQVNEGQIPKSATSVAQDGLPKRPARPRYRDDSPGMGGLWLLLIGMALAVAMIGAGWSQHLKHKRAAAEYREQRLRIMQEREEATRPPRPVLQHAPQPFPGDGGVAPRAPVQAPTPSLPATVTAARASSLPATATVSAVRPVAPVETTTRLERRVDDAGRVEYRQVIESRERP